MKPQKLDEVIQLMKLLDELYYMYKSDEGLGFTQLQGTLSTSKSYYIAANPSIAYIAFRDIQFEMYPEFLYFGSSVEPFHPEIWDDVRAIFPSLWTYWPPSGIRRASTDRLDMMAQTYPALSVDTSLEPDIIDPIIFQNLTLYTMNEVQTQLIALQIHQLNLIAEEKEQKGFRSTMKLDYRVLDLLSPEELLELIQIVGDEIESRKNNV